MSASPVTFAQTNEVIDSAEGSLLAAYYLADRVRRSIELFDVPPELKWWAKEVYLTLDAAIGDVQAAKYEGPWYAAGVKELDETLSRQGA